MEGIKMKAKISSLFSALGAKLNQLKNWFLLTKAWAIIVKCFHYIGVGLHYLFYPIIWIKQRTYDRMRYKKKKIVYQGL